MTAPAADPASRHRSSDPTTPAAALSGVTADEFKAVFRGHPGGVAVITADDGTGPVALTATSVASVSVEPPLLIFSLSSLSSAAPVLAAADTVVVHLLDAADLPLAELASTSGVDRFADRTIWTRLATGEPVFPGARSWIRGRVVNRMAAGGSTIVAVQALQVSIARGEDAPAGEPLVYHNRTWHRLGDHSRIAR